MLITSDKPMGKREVDLRLGWLKYYLFGLQWGNVKAMRVKTPKGFKNAIKVSRFSSLNTSRPGVLCISVESEEQRLLFLQAGSWWSKSMQCLARAT